MTPLKRQTPSVVNKTPGSVCVLDLPTGALRYLTVMLRLTNGANAARKVSDIITEIRIKLDGRTVQRILGTQFSYLRDFVASGYSGHSVGNDPFIVFRWAEMFRRTAGGEDALSWAMNDVGTFQIEFDIKSSVTASELDFTGLYTFEATQPDASIGSILHLEQYTVGANGAGKLTYSVLPKDMPYYKIHCFTDKIGKVLVTKNSVVLYEMTKDQAIADQTSEQFSPDSNVFTIPFDQRLRVSDYVDPRGASEFTLEFEMLADAVPFQLVAEKIGPFRQG